MTGFDRSTNCATTTALIEYSLTRGTKHILRK